LRMRLRVWAALCALGLLQLSTEAANIDQGRRGGGGMRSSSSFSISSGNRAGNSERVVELGSAATTSETTDCSKTPNKPYFMKLYNSLGRYDDKAGPFCPGKFSTNCGCPGRNCKHDGQYLGTSTSVAMSNFHELANGFMNILRKWTPLLQSVCRGTKSCPPKIRMGEASDQRMGSRWFKKTFSKIRKKTKSGFRYLKRKAKRGFRYLKKKAKRGFKYLRSAGKRLLRKVMRKLTRKLKRKLKKIIAKLVRYYLIKAGYACSTNFAALCGAITTLTKDVATFQHTTGEIDTNGRFKAGGGADLNLELPMSLSMLSAWKAAGSLRYCKPPNGPDGTPWARSYLLVRLEEPRGRSGWEEPFCTMVWAMHLSFCSTCCCKDGLIRSAVDASIRVHEEKETSMEVCNMGSKTAEKVVRKSNPKNVGWLPQCNGGGWEGRKGEKPLGNPKIPEELQIYSKSTKAHLAKQDRKCKALRVVFPARPSKISKNEARKRCQKVFFMVDAVARLMASSMRYEDMAPLYMSSKSEGGKKVFNKGNPACMTFKKANPASQLGEQALESDQQGRRGGGRMSLAGSFSLSAGNRAGNSERGLLGSTSLGDSQGSVSRASNTEPESQGRIGKQTEQVLRALVKEETKGSGLGPSDLREVMKTVIAGLKPSAPQAQKESGTKSGTLRADTKQMQGMGELVLQFMQQGNLYLSQILTGACATLIPKLFGTKSKHAVVSVGKFLGKHFRKHFEKQDIKQGIKPKDSRIFRVGGLCHKLCGVFVKKLFNADFLVKRLHDRHSPARYQHGDRCHKGPQKFLVVRYNNAEYWKQKGAKRTRRRRVNWLKSLKKKARFFKKLIKHPKRLFLGLWRKLTTVTNRAPDCAYQMSLELKKCSTCNCGDNGLVVSNIKVEQVEPDEVVKLSNCPSKQSAKPPGCIATIGSNIWYKKGVPGGSCKMEKFGAYLRTQDKRKLHEHRVMCKSWMVLFEGEVRMFFSLLRGAYVNEYFGQDAKGPPKPPHCM